MILFWKYIVDIRSDAWLNVFGEYINGKLFAVHVCEAKQNTFTGIEVFHKNYNGFNKMYEKPNTENKAYFYFAFILSNFTALV
jgi:hypothetical protein